ncbi:hypothetical protein EX30DRAFT_148404 [Ascodesmis nigricans]|uniref:SprT-like domain-containing protein n=1 Tax=Ascodesmis nigricans TaxID=341454 RepID=A0A4S2N1Z3_9PEZI|nr:hypothetical protein EX30DRAFT_148404 [Ascodesmis nigricans]
MPPSPNIDTIHLGGPITHHGPFSSRIHNINTISSQPHQIYSTLYMHRLAYYADAAARKFNFTLHELSEYLYDHRIPSGGPQRITAGYMFHVSPRKPIIRILIRVDPPATPHVFVAEPHALMVLCHEIAHVLMEQKWCSAVYAEHGKTHNRMTLRVWRFLVPLMVHKVRAGESRVFGEAYFRSLLPEFEFRRLKREEWADVRVDMGRWREWVPWCESGNLGLIRAAPTVEVGRRIRDRDGREREMVTMKGLRKKTELRLSICKVCGREYVGKCPFCALEKLVGGAKDRTRYEVVEFWTQKKRKK